jgi:hypothetical protein
MPKISNVIPDFPMPIQPRQYVRTWRDELPEGSKWFPGSNGQPDCKICHGLGWVRFDLPTEHPKFGKLFPCECCSPAIKAEFKRQNDPNLR